MEVKKFKLKIFFLAIFSILSLIFVYNDYFLYQTPILKVTAVQNEEKASTLFRENYYDQKITGIIKNGENKDKTFTFINSVAASYVYGDVVSTHDELLVTIVGDEINEIVNVKRDKYLVWLLVLFIDLILLVDLKKGFKTIISLIVNIFVSFFAILISYNYQNMLLVYLIVSVAFIVFSLAITNSWSRKTKAAIISAISALFVSFTFSFLVIKIYGKDISIWTMDYIEAVSEYENFFYVTLLLSGLGAIMDIAITIASSLNEIILKNPKISKKALLKSGKEISKDIVGTMINVMLYTCYTPIIPLVFLALKNNISLSSALNLYGEVDLIAVFCSAISIVIAIPISLHLSTMILKRGEVK